MPHAASHPFRILLTLAVIALATGQLIGQTYYVDGQTGVDAPGNGTSPATPWRTIGYALAGVPVSATLKTIQIQGDQTYGAATNGESYPLVLPAQVALRGIPGASGQRPRLLIGTGRMGVVVPATVAANGTALDGLVLEGGAVGLTCGAASSTIQRVGMTSCDVLLQTQAAVRVQPGGGVEELTLRDCNLRGIANGIGGGIQYTNVSVSLQLERCNFRDGIGVELNGAMTSAGSGLHRFDAVQCTWHQTAGIQGLGDAGSYPNPPASWTFTECRFVGGTAFRDQPFTGRRNITIDRCAFVDCQTAITCDGAMYSGSSFWTLDRCAFDGCARAVACNSTYHGYYAFTARDTVVRNFTTAFELSSSGEYGTVVLDLERCRVVDGVTAVRHYGMAENGTIRLASTIVARCSGIAIDYAGFHGPGAPALQRFEVVSSTIVDCHHAINVWSEAWTNTIQHVAFDGNATDVALPPAVTCDTCLTDGPPLPGPGNIANTDAGLLRPQYKLLAGSPCIDAGGVMSMLALDYEGDPRVQSGSQLSTPALDIGADEYAPYGSLRPYGFPGRSRDGVQPSIATNSPSARLGVPYDVRVDHANAPNQTGTSFAFLASGLRDLANPLPFDLGAFGIQGSYLWMDPQDVDTPLTVGASGSVATSFQLPYIPQLAGLPIVHQWLVALPGGFGLVTSNALRVSFGL